MPQFQGPALGSFHHPSLPPPQVEKEFHPPGDQKHRHQKATSSSANDLPFATFVIFSIFCPCYFEHVFVSGATWVFVAPHGVFWPKNGSPSLHRHQELIPATSFRPAPRWHRQHHTHRAVHHRKGVLGLGLNSLLFRQVFRAFLR